MNREKAFIWKDTGSISGISDTERRDPIMKAIEIREARAEDAKALLTYLRRIGGESDNLTFDNQGLPFTEEEESRFLESVHRR